MNRTTFKRVAAAGASAALLATGMSVVAGTGVASADAPACEPTKNVTGEKGLVIEQTADKADVAPGGTVTYTTKVSRSEVHTWMLKEVGDFHDPALTLDSSRLNVYWAGKGQEWGPTHLQNDPAKSLYWESGSGWDMTGGHYAILETTYKVSEDAEIGQQLISGVQARPVGWITSQEWPTTGACVTVREKNAVEQAQGSLDSIGLGSVNSGSSEVFGSVTDPQGSISNILSDVLGNVLGDVIGS